MALSRSDRAFGFVAQALSLIGQQWVNRAVSEVGFDAADDWTLKGQAFVDGTSQVQAEELVRFHAGDSLGVGLPVVLLLMPTIVAAVLFVKLKINKMVNSVNMH